VDAEALISLMLISNLLAGFIKEQHSFEQATSSNVFL